jgi:hypothetical protein
LGKAAMSEHRDLGYVRWDPRPDQGGELLSDVQSVLEQYQAQLPLAIRQIYYVLLGKFGCAKGRQFERRLSYVINRARRARLIDFQDIRDDTSAIYQEQWYANIDAYYQAELERRKGFKRDRMADQPYAIEVHVEARGMGPQIYNVTRDFSIRVYPAGGKAHLTDKYEMAQRIVARRDQLTIIISLGDFDPHGISMFDNLADDVTAFVKVDHDQDHPLPLFHRVALTEEQVTKYQLIKEPYQPKSAADHVGWQWYRERDWVVQLEALPPDVLEMELRSAIVGFLDKDSYARTLKREARDRNKLTKELIKALPPPSPSSRNV